MTSTEIEYKQSWWTIEGWAGHRGGSLSVDGYVYSICDTYEQALERRKDDQMADIVLVLTDPRDGSLFMAESQPDLDRT